MIKTKLHRKKNAYRWLSEQACYIVLGGTVAWADDAHPPIEAISQTAINNPFCAIKATVKIVVPDGAGTLEFLDASNFVLTYTEVVGISAFRALDIDVYPSVYVSGTVTGLQISDIIFRQLGVVTDLVPTAGHEDDLFLPSENVESWGDLETLQYRPPTALAVSSSQYTVSTLFQY